MSFELLAFHQDAVGTPSHESVADMQSLVRDALQAAGHAPRIDDGDNLLVTKGDPTDGYHLVLNTHLDTVPPHRPLGHADTIPGTDEPASVVTGRGSCDAKGPLAAMIAAFLAVEPDAGALTLALTPDEETRQTGAAHIAGDLDADGVIVGEPTGLDICHAARGQFEGVITLTGEAAHAAQPEAGNNAVRAAAPILQAIDRFDDDRGPGEHAVLGAPTLTATTIDGGETFNQVPATCRIGFDRRSVPPETADGFEAALTEHLQAVIPAAIDLSVQLVDRDAPFLEAFSTPTDAALVETMATATGGAVRPFGAATEASFFAEHAPTVIFGPGVLADAHGPVAHAEREYVQTDQLQSAAEMLTQATRTLVG